MQPFATLTSRWHIHKRLIRRRPSLRHNVPASSCRSTRESLSFNSSYRVCVCGAVTSRSRDVARVASTFRERSVGLVTLRVEAACCYEGRTSLIYCHGDAAETVWQTGLPDLGQISRHIWQTQLQPRRSWGCQIHLMAGPAEALQRDAAAAHHMLRTATLLCVDRGIQWKACSIQPHTRMLCCCCCRGTDQAYFF